MSVVPLLTPSFLFTGEQQNVVVEFQHDIPSSASIITLSFHAGGNQHNFHGRIPVTKIGPKSIRALFPAFNTSGTYTIVPKFDHDEKSMFPCFDIKILSPLEAIRFCLLPMSADSAPNYPGSVAAILAYLIKAEANNKQENMDLVDDILFSAVQKMNVPFSDLSTFLAGDYGNDNLLHFALRHRLPWTSDWLSNPEVIPSDIAPKWFQSPNQIDGLKPAEIARHVGLLRTAENIDKQVEKSGPWQPSMEEKTGVNWKKSFKNVVKKAGETNVGQYIQNKVSSATGSGNIDSAGAATNEIKGGLDKANDVKVRTQLDVVLTEILSPIKDTSKKIVQVGKYIRKIKKKKSSSKTTDEGSVPPSLRSSGSSGVRLAQSFIHQLKDSALYSGRLLAPYTCNSDSFGCFNLKAGDVVYVIREEANGMCKGIAQEKYCDFPTSIVQPIAYEESEEESGDSEYEEVPNEDYEEIQFNDDTSINQSGSRTPLPPRANIPLLTQKMRSHSIESGLNQRVVPVLPTLTTKTKPIPPKLPIPRHSPPQSPRNRPQEENPSLRQQYPPTSAPPFGGHSSPHEVIHTPSRLEDKPSPINRKVAAPPPLPPKQHHNMPSPSSNRRTTQQNRPLPEIPVAAIEQEPIKEQNQSNSKYFEPVHHKIPSSVVEAIPASPPVPHKRVKKPEDNNSPVINRKMIHQERGESSNSSPVVNTKMMHHERGESNNRPVISRKPNYQERGESSSPVINRKMIHHEGGQQSNKGSSTEHSPPLLPPKPSTPSQDKVSGTPNRDKVHTTKEQPPVQPPEIPLRQQQTPRSPSIELKKSAITKTLPPIPVKRDSPASNVLVKQTETSNEQESNDSGRIANSPSLEKIKKQEPTGVKKTPPPPPIRRGSTLSHKTEEQVMPQTQSCSSPRQPAATRTQKVSNSADVDDEYDDTTQFRKFDENEKDKIQGVQNLISKFKNAQL